MSIDRLRQSCNRRPGILGFAIQIANSDHHCDGERQTARAAVVGHSLQPSQLTAGPLCAHASPTMADQAAEHLGTLTRPFEFCHHRRLREKLAFPPHRAARAP
jgi:hypothetical protein